MRLFPLALNSIRQAAHRRRLALLLAGALLAGLAADWLRPEKRLLFSKPLPAFQVTPATR
jgi:hypothetical protein